jgi:hypothetical protein
MATLPLLMMGGAAVLVVPFVNKFHQGVTDLPEDRKLDEDFFETALQLGLSASAWSSMVDKQFLSGRPLSDVQYINHTPAETGYDPSDPQNGNLMAKLARQHADLYAFDRQDSEYCLSTQQGEVRPGRRQAIVTAAANELHHPSDPTRRTGFLATSYVPNYANPTQIKVAAQAMSQDIERAYRREGGTEFFNRAPFQSFRYTGN